MAARSWGAEDDGQPSVGSMVTCMNCGTLYTVEAVIAGSSAIRAATTDECIALRDQLIAQGRFDDLNELASLRAAYERRRVRAPWSSS
jgi:hypothetical protein